MKKNINICFRFGSITENKILLAPTVIDRARIVIPAILSHLSNTTLCMRTADCFRAPETCLHVNMGKCMEKPLNSDPIE